MTTLSPPATGWADDTRTGSGSASARRGGTAAADRPPRWDTACLVGFAALLVWLPLPLASNRPWALALAALAVWALLAAWCACALGFGAWEHLRRLGRAAPALLPMAAFTALPALQLAAPALGLPAEWATRDPFLTRGFLLASLTCLGVAVLTVLLARTARRAGWLLGFVVGAALVQAVLAVGLYAARGEYLYFFTEFTQGGRASGTFANPDHLAGYMELGLSAGLGLLLAQFGASTGVAAQGARARGVAVLRFLLSPPMLLRVALVVLVVALVMTHSRMGNGAFFLSMLLVGGVVAVASRRLRKPALWLVASMVVIDLVVIGQWVGLDKVVDRIQDTVVATRDDARRARAGDDEALAIVAPAKQAESLQDRLELPFAAWRLVDERPWLGHGGGTFRVVSASSKPAGLNLSAHYWDYAHNDYVQTAVETGHAGLALWLLLGAATAWRAARLLPDHRPRLARGVGVAGLMALSCLGLHSWVDFNLQIPANAAVMTLLVMLVWAVPAASATPARRSRSRGRGHVGRRDPNDDASARRGESPAAA